MSGETARSILVFLWLLFCVGIGFTAFDWPVAPLFGIAVGVAVPAVVAGLVYVLDHAVNAERGSR